MADEKISSLPDGGSVQGADQLVVARGSTNVKILGSEIGGDTMPDYSSQWFVSAEIGNDSNSGTNLADQLETIQAAVTKANVVGKGLIEITDDSLYSENVSVPSGSLGINFDAYFAGILAASGAALTISRNGRYRLNYLQSLGLGDAPLVINTDSYVDVEINQIVGNISAVIVSSSAARGVIKIDDCSGTINFNGGSFYVEIGTMDGSVEGTDNITGFIGATQYGDITYTGDLEVEGTSTLGGETNIESALTVNSTASISGNVIMQSDCSIEGEITGDQNLSIVGDIDSQGDISAADNMQTTNIIAQAREITVTNTSGVTIPKWTVIQSRAPDVLPDQAIAVEAYAGVQGIIGLMTEEIAASATGVAIVLGPIDLPDTNLGATTTVPREIFADNTGQLTYTTTSTPIGFVVNVDESNMPVKAIIDMPTFSYSPSVQQDKIEWLVTNTSGVDIAANRFVQLDPNYNQSGAGHMGVTLMRESADSYSTYPVGYTESILAAGATGKVLRRGWLSNPDIYYAGLTPPFYNGEAFSAYSATAAPENLGRLSPVGSHYVALLSATDGAGNVSSLRLDIPGLTGT